MKCAVCGEKIPNRTIFTPRSDGETYDVRQVMDEAKLLEHMRSHNHD